MSELHVKVPPSPLSPVAPVIFCLYFNDLLLWSAPIKSTTLPLLSKNGSSSRCI